jgi:hypothetical protein
MITKIALVIALCSGVTVDQVEQKLAEMRKANPGVDVSFRLDKKAQCYNGRVLTGKEAKLFQALGK